MISCVGVPEALRGRELFGCAESTYPSLPQAYDGGLARAAGGTLLVDHADQLGSDLWQALAKALADGRFEREGDAGALPLARARDRALARRRSPSAALRDLPHHAIEIPPLAERTEDILPLASHFLGIAAAEAGVEAVGFTGEARAALLAESWPGNARELAERVDQALRLSRQRRDLGRGAARSRRRPSRSPRSRTPSARSSAAM